MKKQEKNMQDNFLTIIKNEHLYLDEWVSYHLGIGINHIFIFEDIDSESHKSIIDRYGNSVTLNSIDVVLNNNGKKEARQLLQIDTCLEGLELFFNL